MTFEQLMKEHRIPVAQPGSHHHVRDGWIGIDCIYCSPGSGKYRMGFRLDYKYVSCWICGKHSLYETLLNLLDISAKEAYQLATDIKGERPAKHEATAQRQGKLQAPGGLTGLAPPHLRYLISRRLDPEKTAKEWLIQGLSIAGRLSWRLWIPIQYRGETVSWTTRSLSDKNPDRYISAKPEEEAVHHKSLLYGEDNCRHAIVIHEGPIDVWTTGPGAVGTLGVDYTQSQYLKMLRFPVRAVCFDNEPEAQRRARKLADQLSGHPGETCNIVLESGKDTNSADPAEVEMIRQKFLY